MKTQVVYFCVIVTSYIRGGIYILRKYLNIPGTWLAFVRFGFCFLGDCLFFF